MLKFIAPFLISHILGRTCLRTEPKFIFKSDSMRSRPVNLIFSILLQFFELKKSNQNLLKRLEISKIYEKSLTCVADEFEFKFNFKTHVENGEHALK